MHRADRLRQTGSELHRGVPSARPGGDARRSTIWIGRGSGYNGQMRKSPRSISQENVVNQVLDDVVRWAKPVWAEVKGEFRPRGGIATVVIAKWPRPNK